MLLSLFARLVIFYCAPTIYFSDYCPITARRWLVKATATDAEGLPREPLVVQTLTQKLVMRLAYRRERTLVLKQYADTDALSKGAPSSSPVFIPDIQHPLSLQSLLPYRSLSADLDPHLPPAWPSMVTTCSFFSYPSHNRTACLKLHRSTEGREISDQTHHLLRDPVSLMSEFICLFYCGVTMATRR